MSLYRAGKVKRNSWGSFWHVGWYLRQRPFIFLLRCLLFFDKYPWHNNFPKYLTRNPISSASTTSLSLGISITVEINGEQRKSFESFLQELPRLEMALWTSLTNRDVDDDEDGHINAHNNDGDSKIDGERLKAIFWISFGFLSFAVFQWQSLLTKLSN